MKAEIGLGKNARAFIVISAIVGLPLVAIADHVPDNLSQDLDPNYIACLAAVDGAEAEFRDALQSTCVERMGDICSGKNGLAPLSQVIECIHFETQRGIGFLEIAANGLPASPQKEGFFGHMYERRRDTILADVEKLRNLPKPETIEIAVEQSVTMASAATTLFWLARETGTSIEAHVSASFGAH
ncbi:hypothetical protein Q8W37_04990 [Shimia thalassica]|uniref:hypothetical protein n=1 Tax=Shimia thalassica TaxID=1715693 RepID=UPI0027346874|nr:hypothetical protein [Shimia thalassica]MDP2579278.1 hypothetical protein [Shimia thalassica]